MALSYTNALHVDQNELRSYTFDGEIGKSTDNDFTLQVKAIAHCCDYGSYIYYEYIDAEGKIVATDYGGIVDGIDSDTGAGTVTYMGRTWSGVMNSKVICPPSGQTHYSVSGDLHAITRQILHDTGLDGLFSVEAGNSGFNVKKKDFRFTYVYKSLLEMYQEVGAKLIMYYSDGIVYVRAERVADYSHDEWDNDQYDFSVMKAKNFINHVICLGSGEGLDRAIVHLYQDQNGNVSETQTFFGLDEIISIYDYSNAGTDDNNAELIKGGTKVLNEAYEKSNALDSAFDSGNTYDIGDIVGATESTTGISVSDPITGKIVKISDGVVSITCKVGDKR